MYFQLKYMNILLSTGWSSSELRGCRKLRCYQPETLRSGMKWELQQLKEIPIENKGLIDCPVEGLYVPALFYTEAFVRILRNIAKKLSDTVFISDLYIF